LPDLSTHFDHKTDTVLSSVGELQKLITGNESRKKIMPLVLQLRSSIVLTESVFNSVGDYFELETTASHCKATWQVSETRGCPKKTVRTCDISYVGIDNRFILSMSIII